MHWKTRPLEALLDRGREDILSPEESSARYSSDSGGDGEELTDISMALLGEFVVLMWIGDTGVRVLGSRGML